MNRKRKTIATSHKPSNFSDSLAKYICKFFRWLADTFFQKRYGHRAVVLETIAAVPGMIAGALIHFRCLRLQRGDNGWIKTLLEEAENERMHLMVFIEIAKPTFFERILILIAQVIFSIFFLFLYLLSPKVAHRLVGYFEEEAITSYSLYLQEIKNNNITNIPAPQIAINYWNLSPDAKLSDIIIAVRNDEAKHRDVNHGFANEL
jgi:ubiquinol oxidase